MIPVPVCMISYVDYESAIKKLFWKSEVLGFTGSVFKQMFLKSSRQAPAATAWEKKTKVNNIKNNTKVQKKQIKDKNTSKI